MIDYTDGNLSDGKRKWFEYEMIRNKSLMENYELFVHIKSMMKARFDLEEVKSDPELTNANQLANQIILEYKNNPDKNERNLDFIYSSLNEEESKSDFPFSNASSKPEIDDITKQWVEDWNSKDNSKNKDTKERRDFINSALNKTENQNPKENKPKSHSLRIIGYVAAALIAILLVIKSLTPSETPDSLYQEYYKPLNAFSSITRGDGKTDNFSEAVKNYNQGEYQQASIMFSELVNIDKNNSKYLFFNGITQLQLGNYQLAISNLNQVISTNNEFTKDAQWYLGLAYLKVGEKDNATLQLKKLTTTKGYYQKQAQDLLDRLK